MSACPISTLSEDTIIRAGNARVVRSKILLMKTENIGRVLGSLIEVSLFYCKSSQVGVARRDDDIVGAIYFLADVESPMEQKRRLVKLSTLLMDDCKRQQSPHNIRMIRAE